MKINKVQEDYIKAIYIISRNNRGGWVSNSEIAEYLGKTPASVSGMLHNLKKNGFISWNPRRAIRLTQEGKSVGERIIENYNKLKDFFIETLNLDDTKQIDKICCDIEHHITPEVIKALDTLI